MKRLSIILICIFAIVQLRAQVVDPANAAKNGATDHVNNNVSNTVDNSLDKTEGAIKGLFKKKKKPDNTQTTTASDATPAPGNGGADTTPGNIKNYKNYDFVPGDKIIFQSNLADESTSEIPSQFTIVNGQMDVQQEDGENVIHVPTGPGATMTPRIKTATYMPDQFTIEFDFKNEKFGVNHLMVDFGSRVYYAAAEGVMPGLTISGGSVNWTLGDVDYPAGMAVDYDHPMQWHHIAIAINKAVGKVYIDQYRVANVNNLAGKASNVTIDVNGYENSYIKNVRIASGGIDIYKEVTTDNKIVTHGILFDVNKSTIKPESMGTINSIYGLLSKTPALKFEINGHTDNTGDAAHNLMLSQQRADAVKVQLVSMGIDASRLTTKGFGDTKPLGPNDSPEGKANNRRVEFVKQN
ncbi:MAG TPA: OmpA family protein [Mucilaginibacter sp.]|jgi:outer membrane protein OmpA-like peptidoglycan-associated protein